jgi:hypothetical protein
MAGQSVGPGRAVVGGAAVVAVQVPGGAGAVLDQHFGQAQACSLSSLALTVSARGACRRI